jgi:DNA gyrase subunit B
MAQPNTPKDNGGYDAGSITVLKGLEAVRKRPAMYIGSTGENGLHHLVYEVVDNSIDEALAGYCDTISVTISKDNEITVVDNGRGIPVDVHPVEKIPGVELALTVLHAGGKFDKSSYKVSGGLHGVGVSVVNALSEKLEVWVDRDGKRHHMAFVRGKTVRKLEVEGKAKGTGTTVWFKPDSQIFSVLEFSWTTLSDRLRQLAYLNKGVKITLKDEREDGKEETFHAKGGLSEFVQWLNRNKKTLHPKPVAFSATKDEVEVDVALQYEEGYNENTFTFVNNINTHEGGTHLTGFKAALTRTVNAIANDLGALKKAGLLAHRRGHPRGPLLRHPRQGEGAAVRGADQDQARQRRGRGHREDGGERAPRELPAGAPRGRAEHHREGRQRGPGA